MYVCMHIHTFSIWRRKKVCIYIYRHIYKIHNIKIEESCAPLGPWHPENKHQSGLPLTGLPSQPEPTGHEEVNGVLLHDKNRPGCSVPETSPARSRTRGPTYKTVFLGLSRTPLAATAGVDAPDLLLGCGSPRPLVSPPFGWHSRGSCSCLLHVSLKATGIILGWIMFIDTDKKKKMMFGRKAMISMK